MDVGACPSGPSPPDPLPQTAGGGGALRAAHRPASRCLRGFGPSLAGGFTRWNQPPGSISAQTAAGLAIATSPAVPYLRTAVPPHLPTASSPALPAGRAGPTWAAA